MPLTFLPLSEILEIIPLLPGFFCCSPLFLYGIVQAVCYILILGTPMSRPLPPAALKEGDPRAPAIGALRLAVGPQPRHISYPYLVSRRAEEPVRCKIKILKVRLRNQMKILSAF